MGAAEIGPSKLRLSQIRIYTQLVILRGLKTVLSKSPWNKSTPNSWCFLSHSEGKLRLMTVVVIWKFCSENHLDSMGANNPPMGLAFDRRGNQEGKGGDVRGSCTQHHRTRSRRRGREGADHSFTFLLHFYFRHWKRKQKKSAKGRKRLSWVNYQVQKRRISWRVWPWDEPQGCLGRKS